MIDQYNTSAQYPEGRRAARRRKPPKSVEQQLADSLAKTKALEKKVAVERDRRRISLVEDLYKQHGIGRIDGDPAERERVATLRQVLDLEG